MRVEPKSRDIAPFPAGDRPSRLRKRRCWQRDERREQWLAWRVEGLDSVAKKTLPSVGNPAMLPAQTEGIIAHAADDVGVVGNA